MYMYGDEKHPILYIYNDENSENSEISYFLHFNSKETRFLSTGNRDFFYISSHNS